MCGSVKPQPQYWRRRQSGFILGALMLTLVVLALAGTAAMATLQDTKAERNIALASSQMKQLNVAVKAYVDSNSAAIHASASSTSPFEIRVSDLVDAGLLPATYQAVNPWKQTYRIFAFSKSVPYTTPAGVSDVREVLEVVTVGQGGLPGGSAHRALNDAEKRLVNVTIPSAAAAIGAAGGFMPSNDYPGATGSRLLGANGIWQYSAGNLPFSPAQGALASLQYFSGGSLDNDYLYRVAVPGRPELNRMATSIDMNGNDVANVESITDMTGYIQTTGDVLTSNGDVFEAETGNITLHDGTVTSGDVVIDDMKVGGASVPVSRGVYDLRTVSPNATVPRPSCPSGASPQIFLAVGGMPLSAANGIQTTSGLRSGNLLAGRARAVTSGSSWRVYLEANIDNTWYRLDSSEGSLLVAPKCT